MRASLVPFLAVLGLALGVGAQYFVHSHSAQHSVSFQPSRRTASVAITESRNDYAKLECLSEEKFRETLTRLHMEIPANIPDFCADKNYGRLSRLLSLAMSLELNIPATWAPKLHDDLMDAVAYVARMSTKIQFDFSQTTSIAFNRPAEKAIYLGGIFFEESPLEAISVLVHEARHSSEKDPGHGQCRLGDIPRTSGGCDEALSIDPQNAGAYSYGAAFYALLGLYAEGLSRGDREYMLSQSLGTVGTRFNNLPPELAQAHDLVLVLDQNKQVSILHPFGGTIPLATPFLESGETVERIEFNVRNNGILFYTSGNRLFTWSPGGQFTRLYDSVLPADANIFEANRIRVPFGDYSYYNFLMAGNEIRYVQFSATEKKYVLSNYPMRGHVRFTDRDPPDIFRFFMALYGNSIFLDRTGIFFLGARWGNEPSFNLRTDLQLPGRRWVYGNGGVLFETLYGIADDGKLYDAKVTWETTDEDEAGDETFDWHLSSLQVAPGRKGVKMQEGLFGRMILDDQGTLTFQSFAGNRRSEWKEKAVKDFVAFRNHSVSSDFRAPAPSAEACGLASTVREPWLGEEVGLDANGRLVRVAEGCPILREVGATELKVLPANESKARNGDSVGEPARLWLRKADGREEVLHPYQF